MVSSGIDAEQPVKGPHQDAQIFEYGAPVSRAKAAMIMVHGRGALAKGMFPLADVFAQPDFHYRAPQARHHSLYPYSFLEPLEKNKAGIYSGLQLLQDVLESVEQARIPKEKVILLGFSQGACLAAEFAASHPQKLGGVVALSGGLIGPVVKREHYTGSMERTPVFIGCGDSDPYVPMDWVHQTGSVFEQLDADVTKKIYEGMGHAISEEEIKIIRGMMANILMDYS